MQPRPDSLAAIARESATFAEFGRHVRDFLREWHRAQVARRDLAPLLGAEPRRLASQFDGGDVSDAFLAALACHLAGEARIDAPFWAASPGRCLPQPWFPLESSPARTWLERAALPEFRRRNVFIDASALARA